VIVLTVALDTDMVEGRVSNIPILPSVDFHSNGRVERSSIVSDGATAVAYEIVPHIASLLKHEAHAVGSTVVVAQVDGEFQIKWRPQMDGTIMPRRPSLRRAGVGELDARGALLGGILDQIPLGA
jgi:hypothetical protein